MKLFPHVKEAEVVEQISAALESATVSRAYISAFRETGMLPTEENEHCWSPEDVEEFNAAYDRAVERGEAP